MNKSPLWQKLLALIGIVAIALIVLSTRPTDYLALEPHAPIDVQPRLKIAGERPEEFHGHLFLVGVTERNLTLTQKWLAGTDPRITLVREAHSKKSQKLDDARDRDSIKESKRVAAYLAYMELGEPVAVRGAGAFVDFVDPGAPADGDLKVGDRIVSVNGKTVQVAPEVSSMIKSLEPGTELELGIRRGQRPDSVTITTATDRDDPTRSRIGIAVSTADIEIDLPKEVTIDTTNIGGPSAGLAFALAIFDAETDEQLLNGRDIVATGALALDGAVVQVGGVFQKAIAAQESGADIMIVPRENSSEAVRGVEQACEGDERCTSVLAVKTYREAVELLQRDPGSLEREFAS